MNSLNVAYWSLRLALPLLVVAATLPWIVRIRSKGLRRGATFALVAVTLLPNLAAALDCAWLRFFDGLEACPWLASAIVLVAQVAGLFLLLRKANRDPGAIDWPSLPLWMAVIVALVLWWTTRVNLDLRRAVSGAQLELEAGRIAYRESPPPGRERNAAPIYAKLAAELAGAGGMLDESVWDLDTKGAIDTNSSALRAVVARSAPALETLRETTRLPRCSFEQPDDRNLVSPLPIAMLLRLSRALVLDSRVRTADGNLRGALEDVSAGLRLSEHVAQTRIMLTALAANAARSVALGALPRILGANGLRAEDLSDFALFPAASAAETFRSATALEESWMLSGLGRAFSMHPNRVTLFTTHSVNSFFRPGSDLALRFYLDEQIAGYRLTIARFREALESGPDEVAARLKSESYTRAASRYKDGLFAPLLTPKLTSVWIPLRRGECELELARAALGAALFRIGHGRYPTTAEEIPGLPADVSWQGDASFARFVSVDPLLKENPPSVDLPPKN